MQLINVNRWRGLFLGLIVGIVIGIMPFFVDGFCNFSEACEMIFLWPLYLLMPIFSLIAKSKGWSAESGLILFFIALIVYPIIGTICGYLIGKHKESKK